MSVSHDGYIDNKQNQTYNRTTNHEMHQIVTVGY
jgi:hypothetical protein